MVAAADGCTVQYRTGTAWMYIQYIQVHAQHAETTREEMDALLRKCRLLMPVMDIVRERGEGEREKSRDTDTRPHESDGTFVQ
jgi:uncharacterized protein YraI